MESNFIHLIKWEKLLSAAPIRCSLYLPMLAWNALNLSARNRMVVRLFLATHPPISHGYNDTPVSPRIHGMAAPSRGLEGKCWVWNPRQRECHIFIRSCCVVQDIMSIRKNLLAFRSPLQRRCSQFAAIVLTEYQTHKLPGRAPGVCHCWIPLKWVLICVYTRIHTWPLESGAVIPP